MREKKIACLPLLLMSLAKAAADTRRPPILMSLIILWVTILMTSSSSCAQRSSQNVSISKPNSWVNGNNWALKGLGISLWNWCYPWCYLAGDVVLTDLCIIKCYWARKNVAGFTVTNRMQTEIQSLDTFMSRVLSFPFIIIFNLRLSCFMFFFLLKICINSCFSGELKPSR